MIDSRKQGIKIGLRQLTLEQLQRLRSYEGGLVLDTWNYHDGCYCPLAVALGLDQWVREPTHEKVYAILALAGFTVNNTWGRSGSFYTDNRYEDLMEAVEEVMEEKQQEEELAERLRVVDYD